MPAAATANMSGKKPYVIVEYGFLLVAYWGRLMLEEIDGNKKLERQKTKLISNLNFVKQKVQRIDHNSEKVCDDVLEWLKETDILIQEMENFKIQSKVPSWNKFKELQEKITTLNVKCKFDSFSTPIPSLERFSSKNKNFMCFKSTDKASDELLEALQDDNCSIIGLYGRQGSGKTTLVKAMRKKIEYLKIFHEVLFVNVTQNLNITKVQDEIADLMNMRLDRNNKVRRARRIFSAIENMDRSILVIFDNVGANFDLSDVGIPCNSSRCKVLLTARCQQDCDLMRCQRKIQLDSLTIEESCTLFRIYSAINRDDENLELLNVAREVAIECEGLPEKIIKVGSSLKSKPMEEWKTSLDNLRNSIPQWQMFISFRGDDTRHSFTGFLYQALHKERFKIFIDDGGLHTGDQISSSLKKAIETSKLSIIVLSENYASSTWCLDELVEILECAELKNQLVWPIFYKVEPSDIRHLRNNYGKDMARHEEKFGINSERVQKWKSALLKVCDLSGRTYTTGYEYELIQKIVEEAKDIESRLQIELEDHRSCQAN